jgi:hypothetical protein
MRVNTLRSKWDSMDPHHRQQRRVETHPRHDGCYDSHHPLSPPDQKLLYQSEMEPSGLLVKGI